MLVSSIIDSRGVIEIYVCPSTISTSADIDYKGICMKLSVTIHKDHFLPVHQHTQLEENSEIPPLLW